MKQNSVRLFLGRTRTSSALRQTLLTKSEIIRKQRSTVKQRLAAQAMMKYTMDESTTPPIMMRPAITVSWFRYAGSLPPVSSTSTGNRANKGHDDVYCSGISRGKGQLVSPPPRHDQATSTSVSWTPTLPGASSRAMEIIDQAYDIALSSTITENDHDDDSDSSCRASRDGNESDRQLIIDDRPDFTMTTYRRDLLTDNLGMFQEQLARFRQADAKRKNRRPPGAQLKKA